MKSPDTTNIAVTVLAILVSVFLGVFVTAVASSTYGLAAAIVLFTFIGFYQYADNWVSRFPNRIQWAVKTKRRQTSIGLFAALIFSALFFLLAWVVVSKSTTVDNIGGLSEQLDLQHEARKAQIENIAGQVAALSQQLDTKTTVPVERGVIEPIGYQPTSTASEAVNVGVSIPQHGPEAFLEIANLGQHPVIVRATGRVVSGEIALRNNDLLYAVKWLGTKDETKNLQRRDRALLSVVAYGRPSSFLGFGNEMCLNFLTASDQTEDGYFTEACRKEPWWFKKLGSFSAEIELHITVTATSTIDSGISDQWNYIFIVNPGADYTSVEFESVASNTAD